MSVSNLCCLNVAYLLSRWSKSSVYFIVYFVKCANLDVEIEACDWSSVLQFIITNYNTVVIL